MKTYLTILLIATIFNNVSTCEIGCLRCGKDNLVCDLCDYEQNYYVSENGKCLTHNIENCDTISSKGECLLCNSGYYLDKNTKNCVKVEKLLENCLNYLGANSCGKCVDGFIVEASNCIQVVNKIDQCKSYKDNNTCESCNSTFEVTSDGKKCVTRPENRNCSVFSNLNCHSCQSGYFYNPNYYIQIYFKNQTQNKNLINFMNFAKYGYGDKYTPSACENIVVDNCAVVEFFDKCKICQEGFFLKSDKTCEKNPYEPIVQCKIYLNHLHCLTCNENFWLENPSTCKEMIKIQNCLQYSPTSESVCTQCDATHFLQSNNCVLRQLNLQECEIYSPTQDFCLKCQSGFSVTSNFKKCLEEIPHCIEYATSDDTTIKLICTKCNSQHYINTNENTCLLGEVVNCNLYTNDPLVCSSCNNLFYLDTNVCEAHKSLGGCENYSLTSKDTCTSCLENHILFTSKNHCIPNLDIQFCATYLNSTTCTKCMDGYKLQSNTCILITLENCLDENVATICNKCKPGYFIENSTCHLYHDYQTLNCAEKVDDGFNSENTLNCGKCSPYTFPKNYLNKYVCVKEERLISESIKLTNCKKHKLTGNSTLCTECEEGYYLNTDDSTCSTTCSGTKVEYLYEGTISATYDITQNPRRKLCKPTPVTGCDIQSVDTFGVLKCLKCSVNFVPEFSGNYTLKRTDTTYGQVDESLGVTYPTYTCHDKTTYTFDNAATTMQANCMSFLKDVTNTQFLCKQCKFGKTGPIKKNTNNNAYYVDCTETISGCNEDYYGGFHFDSIENRHGYNSLLAFNCHSCYAENHIPVNFGISGTNWIYDGVKPFNLDSTQNPSSSLNLIGNLVQCKEITGGDLSFPSIDFTATFIPNCGLAYMHVGRDKNFKTGASDSELSLRCAECKPGYKKILEIANTKSFVSGCEIIANCDQEDNEKWINSCSKCQLSFSWKWDNVNKRIRFDECINNYGDNNCIAISDSQPIYCKYCKKGYIINLDGQCEQLKVPKCESADFGELLTNFASLNLFYRENYLLEYLLPNGIGCSKCVSGYLPFLRVNQKSIACTGSIYLESKKFRSDIQTNYIRFCKEYSGNQVVTFTCKKCQDNYIPNENNTLCLPKINFTNCSIVNLTNTFCSVCDPMYTLRKLACERALIENCVIYDPNADSQKCNLCSEGYYVSNDTKNCILGKLNNCKIYNNNGNCVECESGYGLAELSNQRQSCIYLKDDLFCNSVEVSRFKNHEYKCLTCKTGYSKTEDVTLYDPTICLIINLISNCKVHDIQQNLSSSSLACNECNLNFFTVENGLQCAQRKIEIKNCVLLTSNAETCSQCISDYYPSADGTQCLEYPVGIFNCEIYKEKKICEKCEFGYYLENNKCVLVVGDKIITNCVDYNYADPKLTCSKCISGFYLNSPTECIIAIAQNCLTYENESKCETCSEEYVFDNRTELIKDCIYKPITNCANVDPKSKTCKTCNIEYYPNSVGKCSAVPKIIPNCLVYSAADLCKICNNDNFLALDRKSCILRGNNNLNLMEHCEKTTYEEKSLCIACKPGFLFIEGSCESCLQTSEQGCYACDPLDSSVCLNCISGFSQMKYRGRCSSNIVAEVDNNNGGQGGNSSYLNPVIITVLLFLVVFIH